MRDLHNNLHLVQALAPATRTADATSSEIDRQGFDSLELIASLGTAGDTLSSSVKIEFEVQHSDTSGSGYAACADSDLLYSTAGTNTGTFASVQASGSVGVFKTGYVGGKRYVKVVANLTGTHTNGTPSEVIAVLGHAYGAPVANP